MSRASAQVQSQPDTFSFLPEFWFGFGMYLYYIHCIVMSMIQLEVFREDIPRTAYVNSDRVTAVSGCSYLLTVDQYRVMSF